MVIEYASICHDSHEIGFRALDTLTTSAVGEEESLTTVAQTADTDAVEESAVGDGGTRRLACHRPWGQAPTPSK